MKKLMIVGLDLSHPYAFTPLFRQEGIEVAYILDSDEKRVRDFSEKFGAKPIGSIEDVPWNEVDGVFVATMTCDHVRFARPFVERAIPTFVDKTISPIFNEGKALIDLAKEKNVPFLSGSARRFSPAFASLVNESKTEGFGKPLIASRFEPHGISPGHWQERRETSGGFIKNFGVHCVDNLVQIFGSDVKQVNCLSGKFLNQNAESEDSAVITIQFGDGGVGIAEVLGAQSPCKATQPHFRVHGGKQSYEAYVDEGFVREFRGRPVYDAASYDFVSGYQQIVKCFSTMVKERIQPIPYEHYLATELILEMARRSADEGRQILVTDVLS
jgi:predicted dehydrogenase